MFICRQCGGSSQAAPASPGMLRHGLGLHIFKGEQGGVPSNDRACCEEEVSSCNLQNMHSALLYKSNHRHKEDRGGELQLIMQKARRSCSLSSAWALQFSGNAGVSSSVRNGQVHESTSISVPFPGT